MTFSDDDITAELEQLSLDTPGKPQEELKPQEKLKTEAQVNL